jgi:hypothetical protein
MVIGGGGRGDGEGDEGKACPVGMQGKVISGKAKNKAKRGSSDK